MRQGPTLNGTTIKSKNIITGTTLIITKMSRNRTVLWLQCQFMFKYKKVYMSWFLSFTEAMFQEVILPLYDKANESVTNMGVICGCYRGQLKLSWLNHKFRWYIDTNEIYIWKIIQIKIIISLVYKLWAVNR